MGTLAWVAAGSLLSTSVFLAVHVAIDYFRSLRLRDIALVPNCLLTRYPIVFITGRRSVFYFLNYWNQVPAFLAAHGYEIEVLELPWRGSDRRLDALKAVLVARRRPCHLIGDSSIEAELSAARHWGLLNLKSATIVECEDRTVRGRASVSDLRPRRDGLRPLALPKASVKLGAAPAAAWLQALFLSLHNALAAETNIVAAEIGLSLSGQTWIVERKFLELAISLAEDDAR